MNPVLLIAAIMFLCTNFHWIARLFFIIAVCAIRIQTANLPVLYDLPDFSRDHWTTPTVITDNLSFTNYICTYGVSGKLSSSRPTILPGLIQHKHKLSHKLITASLLLILAGDIASKALTLGLMPLENPGILVCIAVRALPPEVKQFAAMAVRGGFM